VISAAGKTTTIPITAVTTKASIKLTSTGTITGNVNGKSLPGTWGSGTKYPKTNSGILKGLTSGAKTVIVTGVRVVGAIAFVVSVADFGGCMNGGGDLATCAASAATGIPYGAIDDPYAYCNYDPACITGYKVGMDIGPKIGAKIGATIGGINFTAIPISVAGDYSDLRYVSFNNHAFNTLSKESNSSLYSMEIFQTASLFPDEAFWISIDPNYEGNDIANVSVVMDDSIRNTTVGWVFFNADYSLKELYYLMHNENMKNEIQDKCNGGSYKGRFWIDPDYVNAYVDGNGIYINDSKLKVSFELLDASTQCVNTTVTNYANINITGNMSYYVNNDVLPGLVDPYMKEAIRQSFRDLRSTYNTIAITQWLKDEELIRDPATMTPEEYDESVDVIMRNESGYNIHYTDTGTPCAKPLIGGNPGVPETVDAPCSYHTWTHEEGSVYVQIEGGVDFSNITITKFDMPAEFKQNLRASVIDAWNSSSMIANFKGNNYALYGVKFINVEPNVSEIDVGETVKFNINSNYVLSDNVTLSIDGFELVSANPSPMEISSIYNSEIQGNTLNVVWDVVDNFVDYEVIVKASSTRYLKYSVRAEESGGVLEYNGSIKVLPECEPLPTGLFNINDYVGSDVEIYVPQAIVDADSDLILRVPVYIVNKGNVDHNITLWINSTNDSSVYMDRLLPCESFNFTAWLWFPEPESCDAHHNINFFANITDDDGSGISNEVFVGNYVHVHKPPHPADLSVSHPDSATGESMNIQVNFTNIGCSEGTFNLYAFTNESYLAVIPYEVNVAAQSLSTLDVSINVSELTGTNNITLVVESYNGFYDFECFVVQVTQSDTTPPNVTINEPKPQTYTSTSLTLKTTISDDNSVDSCWYSLNNWATNITYNCVSATFTASEGSNTVRVGANDSYGNVNASESITFIVGGYIKTYVKNKDNNNVYAKIYIDGNPKGYQYISPGSTKYFGNYAVNPGNHVIKLSWYDYGTQQWYSKTKNVYVSSGATSYAMLETDNHL